MVVVVVVVVDVVAVVVAVSTLRRCCNTPALPGAISQGVASSQWTGVANLNSVSLINFICCKVSYVGISDLDLGIKTSNIQMAAVDGTELAGCPPTRLICQPYNLSLHNSTTT